VKWTEGREDVRGYKMQSNMMGKRRGEGRNRASGKGE